MAYRQMRLEIARQFRENPMLGGRPAFDAIGGGAGPFTAVGRPGRRDLISEFQSMGYHYVPTASGLKTGNTGQSLIGLFKGSRQPAAASNGIAISSGVSLDRRL
mgnify:CR=1 FL=1